MIIKPDLEQVVAQEATLTFAAFDEAAAFSVGSAIRDIALDEGLGVVCDIRFWDRPLFYMALPGTTADNPEWVRRKANVVRRFGKSTYRMVLEHGAGEGRRALPADFGARPEEYVLAGGGFPLAVARVGIIGAITVSGIPEHEDHMLVVRGICRHLGVDHSQIGARWR
ncbi:heme-degrading domain-containing protein [Pelagibacterium montanilacus]|uniref:heme-degrading domain-containing protein n=1 Tax=Pelagibacterium montanilacus TaxID=2185280 RepID=UPI000F8DFB01|nr:heme-degrading domain-containing protein [Pelagibacterium montanilacus]